MEAHGIDRTEGFAVLRQVSAGAVYPESQELRHLIQRNAQRMTATVKESMYTKAQVQAMMKKGQTGGANMNMSDMEKQILKKLQKMSISKREKIWKKTEPRYKAIVEKISKLPTQEEKMKYKNKLSANDKEALMLYRIFVMQRQREMQDTMQKQRSIAYEVNAKIQKMDEKQKIERLDEIRSEANEVLVKMSKLGPQEQIRYQHNMPDEKAKLMAEFQALNSMVVQKDKKETLRFKIGDRVLANVGSSWEKGTIVRTHYSAPFDLSGRVMPYQIKLDMGQLIMAPMDNNVVVRNVPEGMFLEFEPSLRARISHFSYPFVCITHMYHSQIHVTGTEDPRENSMRVVLAKLQSMTEVERMKRLEMYKKDGMDTRCEAIEKMPKDIQDRHQKSLSLKELQELIEYRFLVRMVELQKITATQKKEEKDVESTAAKGREAKKETSNIPTFRFCVGQRVKCNCGQIWQNGRIVAILYREPHWPKGRYVPYQVKLDSGKLIYAPMDDDRLIQSVGEVLKKPQNTTTHDHHHSHGGHGSCCDHDHSHGDHHHSHGDHGSCCDKKHDDPIHHQEKKSPISSQATTEKSEFHRPGLSKRKNATKKMMETTPDDYDGFSL